MSCCVVFLYALNICHAFVALLRFYITEVEMSISFLVSFCKTKSSINSIQLTLEYSYTSFKQSYIIQITPKVSFLFCFYFKGPCTFSRTLAVISATPVFAAQIPSVRCLDNFGAVVTTVLYELIQVVS